MMYCSR